jgi:hypothetical protein
MTSEGGVLVVAFDGMDKELVEEFSPSNIIQEEFGSIDNSTGISKRMTSELFASFITGKTYESHGVKGLSKPDKKWKEDFLNSKIVDYARNNVRGFHRVHQTLKAALRYNSYHYTKDDIQEKTLFDEINASLPLYVPSYNPDPYWSAGIPHKFFNNLPNQEAINSARRDTQRRLHFGSSNSPAFFDITPEFWDFIMLHLHDPDVFHDTYTGDLEEEYNRLDEIAGQILEFIPDSWTVIFMSDHGKMMNEKFEHNTNAFYSCNKELFSTEEPKITDFYQKLKSITE